MATNAQLQELARSQLNKRELAVFEAVLTSVAPLIDALLRDNGVPYTKIAVPPQEVQ